MQISVESILEMAIENEKNAENLYKTLADSITNDQELAEEIRKLALMEKKHGDTLQELQNKELKAKAFLDKNSFSFLDTDAQQSEPINPNITWIELVQFAIRKESNAIELYKSLALYFEEPEIKNIFNILVAEETKHKKYFETLLKKNVKFKMSFEGTTDAEAS